MILALKHYLADYCLGLVFEGLEISFSQPEIEYEDYLYSTMDPNHSNPYMTRTGDLPNWVWSCYELVEIDGKLWHRFYK